MNKVIIITRDDTSYCKCKSTWLSQPEYNTKCLYPHYDAYCNCCEGQVFNNTMLKKFLAPQVARTVADFGKLESISFEDSDCFLTTIDSIIEAAPQENQCYDSIQCNDKGVTMFYINRTIRKKVEVDALPQFLYVICHDCGIDLNDVNKEENILYIHDTEWGVNGEFVLMQNQKITSEAKPDKIPLLEKLKNKFSYVATFQHIDRYGGIFRDIIDGKFGGTPLSNKLGELENNDNCNCFEDLLESCETVLEKPKQ